MYVQYCTVQPYNDKKNSRRKLKRVTEKKRKRNTLNKNLRCDGSMVAHLTASRSAGFEFDTATANNGSQCQFPVWVATY
jgi:hypothetical protein